MPFRSIHSEKDVGLLPRSPDEIVVLKSSSRSNKVFTLSVSTGQLTPF